MTTMMASQVKVLLMLASQLSGYSIPADAGMPVVNELTKKQMAVSVCGATNDFEALMCPVLGVTSMETGEINVDAESTTAPGAGTPEGEKSLNTVVLHELVHWLQFKHGKFDERWFCPGRFLMEYEAYEAEVKYQVTYENYPIPNAVAIPETYCPTQPMKK